MIDARVGSRPKPASPPARRRVLQDLLPVAREVAALPRAEHGGAIFGLSTRGALPPPWKRDCDLVLEEEWIGVRDMQRPGQAPWPFGTPCSGVEGRGSPIKDTFQLG